MNNSSRTRLNTARRSDDPSGIRYFGSEEPEIVAAYSSATASGVDGGDLRKVMLRYSCCEMSAAASATASRANSGASGMMILSRRGSFHQHGARRAEGSRYGGVPHYGN